LQPEVRADDAPVLLDRSDILHFGAELKTYADTAALIANLDLVISVDTSEAHSPVRWQNRSGIAAVHPRLALTARSRGQSVVPDGTPVSSG
jgi:hypothetical protein